MISKNKWWLHFFSLGGLLIAYMGVIQAIQFAENLDISYLFMGALLWIAGLVVFVNAQFDLREVKK